MCIKGGLSWDWHVKVAGQLKYIDQELSRMQKYLAIALTLFIFRISFTSSAIVCNDDYNANICYKFGKFEI